MADMLETVTVTIGTTVLTGWTGITFTAGAEQSVRQARIDLPLSLVKGIARGSEATVKAGGDLILTGTVRDKDRSHDGTDSQATLTIVSLTADLTESSIDHATGYVEDADLKQIAKEFAKKYKVIVKAKSLGKLPLHQSVPAETIHKTLERIARRQGILIYDDGTGALVLADRPEGQHAGGIAYGVNILSASVAETEAGRYGRTIVRGQSSKGHGAGALRGEATATDRTVRPERVKVILHEGDATTTDIRKRAEWQARRAAGLALRATVTVPGWRDAKGRVWSPNWLVHLKDPDLEINQLMAVSQATLTQDADGTRAELQLVDPRAFGGEDPKGEISVAVAAPKTTAKVVE